MDEFEQIDANFAKVAEMFEAVDKRLKKLERAYNAAKRNEKLTPRKR
jgi:uncharacterized protein YdcH (DUF465 family)